jgi:hypothetical protein
MENFKQGIKEKPRLFSGFDLIYFDKEFIENEKVINALNNYIFNDWGVFEHFLISLNELLTNVTLINIYQESKVYKIENNRKLTNESNQFFINSHKLNSAVFSNFLYDNAIMDNYFDLTYCHLKFRLTKNRISHYIYFSKDIITYFTRRLVKVMSLLIPIELKMLVKKIKGGGTKK